MADKKISALTAASLPLAGTEVLPIVQSGATVKVATDDLTVKNIRSNATTGLLQIAGPGAGTTRVMTTPNANFTSARIDAAQTFTGIQSFAGSGGKNVRIYGGSAAHEWDVYGSGNNLRFSDNTGSGFVQFDTDVNMNGGNLIQGTAAKGVNFTANTPAAGMTSQLLNWYEEGTWTPTVSGASGTTYTTQLGWYTRVGNLVTVGFELTINSEGTITGGAAIAGLPFTSAATYKSSGSLTYAATVETSIVWQGLTIGASQSVLTIYIRTAASTSTTSINGSDFFANGTQIIGQMTYRV
jgi:hypothetical protein